MTTRVPESILRRAESARLAGTSIKELAREFGFSYADLSKAMKCWRKRHGCDRKVGFRKLAAAADKYLDA